MHNHIGCSLNGIIFQSNLNEISNIIIFSMYFSHLFSPELAQYGKLCRVFSFLLDNIFFNMYKLEVPSFFFQNLLDSSQVSFNRMYCRPLFKVLCHNCRVDIILV